MENAKHFIVWYTTESGVERPFSVKGNALFCRTEALRHSLSLSLRGYSVWLDDVGALLQ